MDESDNNLSSDWDIVNSSNGDFEDSLHEYSTKDDLPKNGNSAALEAANSPKGSCVDEIVPEKTHGHSESNSSSDIDIIDENALDDSHSDISIPFMKFSLSSSMGDGFTPLTPLSSFQETSNTISDSEVQGTSLPGKLPLNVPFVCEDCAVADNDSTLSIGSINEKNQDRSPLMEIPWVKRRHTIAPQLKQFFVVFFLGFFVALILISDSPPCLKKQMEERVSILQAENSKLKNHVLSKLEDDQRPLIALEEEIKALKSENIKLSNCMKDLIFQMEEQNTLFRKENEAKERELYKIEIDTLKEQINILQIDNEELQKQLVRVRYGIYSPHSRDSKGVKIGAKSEENESHMKEKSEKTNSKKEGKELLDEFEKINSESETDARLSENEEGKISESKYVKEKSFDENKSETSRKSAEEKSDNSTEIINKEIQELRRKLYSEVEKLKTWKESVQYLMDKLKNHPEGLIFENGKEDSHRKSSHDHMKSEEPQSKQEYKKEKKFYDWILKNLQNNLKDTVDNFPDMNVDKKKMNSIFESVGNYFKKAQEKTRKMFDFKDKKKNEIWKFLNDLRRKWYDMKNEFVEGLYGKKDKSEDYTHNKKEPHHKTYKTDKKFDHKAEFNSNQPKKSQTSDDTTKYRYKDPKEELKATDADKMRDDSNLKYQPYAFKGDSENKFDHDPDSWLFKRAEYRSELREKADEVTNWFLRKGNEHNINQYDHLEDADQDVFI